MKKHSLTALCGALLCSVLSGCMTGPTIFERNDPYSVAEPGSPEWWNEKAMLPPGVRQECKKGKVWPMRPRSTAEPQQFSHTFHSAHYWPLPYVCQDRQSVNDMIEAQVSLGWQEETTLYDMHFTDDVTLTEPARRKLIDIIQIVPLHRRTVYVQQTIDPTVTQARVTAVQNMLRELTNGAEEIPVVARSARLYSRPAGEVKALNDLYRQSIPSPRITLGTAGGGGGGGGAAGGGGGGAGGP